MVALDIDGSKTTTLAPRLPPPGIVGPVPPPSSPKTLNSQSE
jgi:hypothetical protein